jgi:MFS family permease
MPTGVWRQRDFLLVLGGGLVNDIGDWLLAVALPAYVYTQTGSGVSTAAIVVIELIAGIVFGPYGGSLADRWDLRRAVVGTNVLQAVTLVPLLAVDTDRIWPAFVVAGMQGLLQQVNDPASFALVPRIVPADDLVQANSAYSAASSIARLVGSPLGGIAVAVGGLQAVVVVDAISFLTVAAATALVRTPTAPLVIDEAGGTEASVRGGWQEIRRRRGLTGYLGVQTLASLTFAMFPVLFIAFVVDVLSGDEATVGIIRGVAAFGGITASVLIGRFAKRVEPTRLMMWGYAGLGAVALVFVNVAAVTTALWIFFVLFALSGLPNITSQVGATTTAQRLCPAAVLGRLRGILSAAGAAGALAGSIGVGLLVDHVDVRVLLNAQALLYVACGAATYATIVRPVASAPRRVGETDDGPPTDRPAGEDATQHRG